MASKSIPFQESGRPGDGPLIGYAIAARIVSPHVTLSGDAWWVYARSGLLTLTGGISSAPSPVGSKKLAGELRAYPYRLHSTGLFRHLSGPSSKSGSGVKKRLIPGS